MNHDIMTTAEAADYLRLSKPTLERARVSGDGPLYCKLGGSVRYRRADLETWLQSRLTASTSANHQQPAAYHMDGTQVTGPRRRLHAHPA
jgi:excisionase family DNA binding protein